MHYSIRKVFDTSKIKILNFIFWILLGYLFLSVGIPIWTHLELEAFIGLKRFHCSYINILWHHGIARNFFLGDSVLHCLRQTNFFPLVCTLLTYFWINIFILLINKQNADMPFIPCSWIFLFQKIDNGRLWIQTVKEFRKKAWMLFYQ